VKFLCVKCDEPMKLVSSSPPERGSMSVVYSCPSCSHEIAMLTNPHETQMVTSLGVRIGSGAEGEGQAAGSGCPFSELAREMESAPPGGGLSWTPRALERLQHIPEFVRPMARTGIEKFARDEGAREVDEALLDRAREFFGM
jgi:hypothetical protein